MPNLSLRGWAELTKEEKADIETAYPTMTNAEIVDQWGVNRQALTRAARGFAEENRFKTQATRRRAYADRSRAVLDQHSDGDSDTPEAEPDPAAEIETHRVQAELRELRRVKRSKLDSDVWTKTVISAIEEQLPHLAPTTRRPEPSPEPVTSEHFLVLSDLQLGSHVDVSEMGGLSVYSWEVFLDRLRRLEAEIVAIKQAHGGRAIRRLNILGLGDYADGQSIFRGQPFEIDRHVVQQNTEGPWEISQMLVRLLAEYDSIVMYTVYGNHGRLTERREAAPTHASWDFIFVKFLENMTSLSLDKQDRRRVQFVFADSWWLLVERLGCRLLLLHGEDIRSSLSIPYYGMERTRQRMTNLLQQHLPPNSGPITFDVMCTGHFHTPAFISTASGPILMSGCWPGASKFSAKTMQAASAPSQWFGEIREGRGISALWNVALSDPDETREIEVITD
jgi:hypothetical protein